MKKLISAILAVICVLSTASALAENWYVKEGQSLVKHIVELAGDDAYTALYTAPGDIRAIIDEFAESDFTSPTEARMLSLPDSEAALELLSAVASFAAEDIPEISDAALKELIKRLPGMIVTLVNNQHGTVWIAATTILSASETHVMPEDFQPGILLLEYPGEYSVAVTFSKTGDNTVTATATAIHSGFISLITKDMSILERIAFEAMFRRVDLS